MTLRIKDIITNITHKISNTIRKWTSVRKILLKDMKALSISLNLTGLMIPLHTILIIPSIIHPEML